VSTNSVHIKSGTYTLTGFVSVGAGLWLNFIGYGTTHNDGGTKPIITTSTSAINLFEVNVAKCSFTNITFTNTAATRYAAVALINSDSAATFVNCLFDGMGNALYSAGSQRPSYIINSEIKNSTGDGVFVIGRVVVYGSYIHNNATNGVATTGADNSMLAAVIIRSIITNNVDGVSATTGFQRGGGRIHYC